MVKCFRRWQLIRDVGNPGTPGTMSTRASISATTAYSVVNKIDMSQVSECFKLVFCKTLGLGLGAKLNKSR